MRYVRKLTAAFPKWRLVLGTTTLTQAQRAAWMAESWASGRPSFRVTQCRDDVKAGATLQRAWAVYLAARMVARDECIK